MRLVVTVLTIANNIPKSVGHGPINVNEGSLYKTKMAPAVIVMTVRYVTVLYFWPRSQYIATVNAGLYRSC